MAGTVAATVRIGPGPSQRCGCIRLYQACVRMRHRLRAHAEVQAGVGGTRNRRLQWSSITMPVRRTRSDDGAGVIRRGEEVVALAGHRGATGGRAACADSPPRRSDVGASRRSHEVSRAIAHAETGPMESRPATREVAQRTPRAAAWPGPWTRQPKVWASVRHLRSVSAHTRAGAAAAPAELLDFCARLIGTVLVMGRGSPAGHKPRGCAVAGDRAVQRWYSRRAERRCFCASPTGLRRNCELATNWTHCCAIATLQRVVESSGEVARRSGETDCH
jgi:hypothetical protein